MRLPSAPCRLLTDAQFRFRVGRKVLFRFLQFGMILSLLIVCGMETLVVLGMHNYTPWSELASNASPHVFYGTSLLGRAGILYIGGMMVIINATGLSGTSQLSSLILIGCVFWMAAYAISCVDVLVFRHRLPKAPRTFKVPFGPVIPILGIAGNIFMMANISSDPSVRAMIYRFVLLVFAALAVYAVVWIRKVMKMPLFRPVPVQTVMAMENEMYQFVRKKRKQKSA